MPNFLVIYKALLMSGCLSGLQTTKPWKSALPIILTRSATIQNWHRIKQIQFTSTRSVKIGQIAYREKLEHNCKVYQVLCSNSSQWFSIYLHQKLYKNIVNASVKHFKKIDKTMKSGETAVFHNLNERLKFALSNRGFCVDLWFASSARTVDSFNHWKTATQAQEIWIVKEELNHGFYGKK